MRRPGRPDESTPRPHLASVGQQRVDHRTVSPNLPRPGPAAPPVLPRCRPQATVRAGQRERAVKDLPHAPDDPNASSWLGRTLGFWQLRHYQVVRGVDHLLDLIRRARPVEGEGVPAVLADLRHLGRGALVAVEQQIGSLAVTTLQADRRLVLDRSEKGKDLVAHLGDHITFPGLVLPGARLAKAVVEPPTATRHSASFHPQNVSTQLAIRRAPASPDFSGWNWVDQSGPSSTAATNRSPPCSAQVMRRCGAAGSARTP